MRSDPYPRLIHVNDGAIAGLMLGQERRLENLFKALADDPDNEYAMIDATIVRAHQHSAGTQKKTALTKL